MGQNIKEHSLEYKQGVVTVLCLFLMFFMSLLLPRRAQGRTHVSYANTLLGHDKHHAQATQSLAACEHSPVPLAQVQSV